MEENKHLPNEPGRPLQPEEAAKVGGGEDCSTNTFSITVGGVTFTFTGSITGAYSDAVQATSTAIESVAKAF